MNDIDLNQITIDKLRLHGLVEKKIEVSVLRIDKIHPNISGNKWFKLKYFLEDARSQKKNHIVTYGGAWSNHLLATAAVCQSQRLVCTGIIRGEKPGDFSETLKQVSEMGMQLYFMNREDYKNKILPDVFNSSDCYVIPEGGSGITGITGAKEIMICFNKENYSHVACAVGSGTTLYGLIYGSLSKQNIIGVPVIRGLQGITDNQETAQTLLKDNFTLLRDYHFGGYAKYTPELIQFMNDLYRQTTIPTDFVYTGKLFYAILDQIKLGFFPAGSTVLIVHSGGLQGNRSLENGTLIF